MIKKAIATIENIKQFLDGLWQSGVKKVFYGSEAHWNSLSSAQKNKYDAYFTTENVATDVNSAATVTNVNLPGVDFIKDKVIETHAKWLNDKPIKKFVFQYICNGNDIGSISFDSNKYPELKGKKDIIHALCTVSFSDVKDVDTFNGVCFIDIPSKRHDYSTRPQEIFYTIEDNGKLLSVYIQSPYFKLDKAKVTMIIWFVTKD